MKTSTPFPHRNRVFRFLATSAVIALSFAARAQEVVFPSNLLQPPEGMYGNTGQPFALYANGIIHRDLSARSFTDPLPPPALGAPAQVHSFSAEVRMMVSTDGGVSFFPATAPAQVTTRIVAVAVAVGAPQRYDTEMLQLSISGGTLPAAMMIRESPTLASTGRTNIRTIGSTGAAGIGSFFDIFTEISLDGGATWSPAQAAGRVELRGDPTKTAPIKTPTRLLPPPNDRYASPALSQVSFAPGVVVRRVKHHFFTQSLPAPPQGGPAQTHVFDSQVDMEVSVDGGLTFQRMRAPAAVTMQVSPRALWDTTDVFDTEMLALNIQGGDLPPGVMLRESPTRRSYGGTAIQQLPPGDPDFDLLRIGSFFDIFTEMSLDGGATWSPADTAAHVVLESSAPELTETSPNFPPPDEGYVSVSGANAAFASGVILKDLQLDGFSQSTPPPPPGGSQIHSFQAQVQFRISTDGGATFQPGRAPAQCVAQVRSSVDDATTRYFDTEMLALDISGGTLPAGVRLRESPTKASLGRTSIRQSFGGGALSFGVASFFDIFTELSVDGGATWQPTTSGPAGVALSRPPRPHFFTSNVLPPATGAYVSPADFHAAYANGVIIQNVSHKRFTQSLLPPPPGGTQVHNFGSTVEMDVSADGGATFQRVSAPASVIARVTHVADDGPTSFFDTEMLALNIAGGGLPTGILVRESPTKASLGRTSIESLGGGFMIDSFFDIFTELSVDGGQTWSPAAEAGHVELTIDPTAITPIKAPTNLFPPPNDSFTSTTLFYALFAQGVVIRDVRHHFFSNSLPSPPLGQSQTHTFDSQVDMEVSIDGGLTFRPMRAPALARMRVTHTRDEGTTQIFDTEMLQLDLQGGDLLPGVMLRESPTKISTGGTAIVRAATGDPDFDLLRIGSFFDIFTEMSVDGGLNWSPASGPSHVELQSSAEEIVETSPNLPPPDDAYVGTGAIDAAFPSGIILKGLDLDRFTQSLPPPPPGGVQVHSFQSQVQFRISQDGGVTFNPASASAQCVVLVRSSVDAGSTRYFDTEMLQLDLSGGTLPPGVMVRESPSKASLGRTSVRLATGASGTTTYHLDSFFDIFTELSLDGGASWQSHVTQPAEVVLSKPPRPHFFTTNLLPPPNGVDASANGVSFATYANGIIVRNVSHKRFTQGLPPPPPGGTQVHSFGSTVEMDVSLDGGATFQHVSAPASASMRVSHVADSGTTAVFDTEMLALNIASGGLPAGVMVRESPTRASLGRTSIESIGGGFMIDSFFDIFTELSLDGGQTWSPSAEPGHVELGVDPTLIPPVQAPTTLLPPPLDFYQSTELIYALFAQGIVIRDVKLHLFSQSTPAPTLGASLEQTFEAVMDMEISFDGGLTFQHRRGLNAVNVKLAHTRDEGTTQVFDTEMLALNLVGGDLPAGVMLRESPTRRSEGGTAITPNSDGTQRISSFFDIFTELSVDGGATWSPASAPSHVELQSNAPELVETSPNLPPLLDEFLSVAAFDSAFAAGVIIRDVKYDRFTQAIPPPPPGATQLHTFNSRVRFLVSQNGGATFTPGLAFASVEMLVKSSQDQDSTRYFDTEMLALNISGGSLPAGVMLRESPTRASLGRTSVRTVPTGYRIGSFFDIFTELSLDGGQTWSPTLAGPGEFALHEPDADNDGLEDAWEITFFGTLAQSPTEDSDGDGETNLDELIAGTSPTDPKSVLSQRAARLGNAVAITFPSVLGRKYTIETKTDLTSTLPWTPVQSGIQGTDAPITITLPNVFDVPRRFYHVVVELVP
jgi:hypothetical protein